MLRIGLGIAAFTFICDRFTKWLVLDVWNLGDRSYEVAPFFNILVVPPLKLPRFSALVFSVVNDTPGPGCDTKCFGEGELDLLLTLADTAASFKLALPFAGSSIRVLGKIRRINRTKLLALE